MLKKASLILFVITIFSANLQFVFAKSQNDWNKVSNLTDKGIAVKNSNNKTIFGKLTAVNADEIVIQIADKKQLTSQSITVKKSEVKKIWSATLRFRNNKGLATGVGAGIGLGIGLGIGYLLLAATGGSDEGKEILATGAVIGAGAGAALGFLVGNGGHQKNDLIYEK